MNLPIAKWTLPVLLFAGVTFSGCVSTKKYNTAQNRVETLEAENAELHKIANNWETRYEMREVEIEKRIIEENEELRQKLHDLGMAYYDIQEDLNERNEKLQTLWASVENSFEPFYDEEIEFEELDGKIRITFYDRILFESGSAKITKDGQEALKLLADVLAMDPDMTMIVEGHTDAVPVVHSDHKDNLDLSFERGEAVYRVLHKQHGIPADRILATGRGDHFPVATNDTEAGRELNRRVEFLLVPEIEHVIHMLDLASGE